MTTKPAMMPNVIIAGENTSSSSMMPVAGNWAGRGPEPTPLATTRGVSVATLGVALAPMMVGVLLTVVSTALPVVSVSL